MIPWRDINLLCPGPSLKNADPDLDLLTVGINVAVEGFPIDWWCAGDDAPIEETKALPKIGLASKLTTVNKVRAGQLRPKRVDWDPNLHLFNFGIYGHHGRPWYTSWFALFLCRSLGARRLNIYGMDLAGKSYFKETKYIGKFAAVRFEKEKAKIEQIFEEFERINGIEIIKH